MGYLRKELVNKRLDPFHHVAGWQDFIYVYSVVFVNEKVGWARAQDVTILHTEDGGKTWTIQYSER